MIICSYWVRRVFLPSPRQDRCCFWPLALLQGKAKSLTKYQTVLSGTTLRLPAPLRFANTGGPQRYRNLSPDTPFYPTVQWRHSFHLPQKKKRRIISLQICVYKISMYKNMTMCSAISLGQYTLSFLCSFHWHFVKFVTGRGLPLLYKLRERQP